MTGRASSHPIDNRPSITAANASSDSLDLDLELDVDVDVDSYEMVQKYGAVVTTAADATEGDSEHSALLAGGATPQLKEGHATIMSSVSNLLNTIMGSGMYSRSMYVMSRIN